MTEVWTDTHGWCYLHAIVDCCTREIPGWSVDLRYRADKVGSGSGRSRRGGAEPRGDRSVRSSPRRRRGWAEIAPKLEANVTPRHAVAPPARALNSLGR
jgi:transposase InsO family protein